MSEPLDAIGVAARDAAAAVDGTEDVRDRRALDPKPPEARVYPGTDVPLADKLETARARRRAEDAALVGQHPLIRDLLLTPGNWRIWPAVAVLRWMLRQTSADGGRLVYRSKPSLDFSPGEIDAVELTGSGVVGLLLRSPGIAAPGSPLPTADILRIMQDQRRGGVIAQWLDGFGDRFMQSVESAQAQNNVAFALASGGEIPTLRAVSRIVGHSAPLASDRHASLQSTWNEPPHGALGLAPFFMGAISRANLKDLVEAFTGLAARIIEFAGADVANTRPARLGVGAFGAMLGNHCRLAAAGVEVVLKGGTDASSLKWGRELPRRRSLYALAAAFVGAPSPEVRFYLELDAAVLPAAELGVAELGGVAVLGRAEDVVRLPLAHR